MVSSWSDDFGGVYTLHFEVEIIKQVDKNALKKQYNEDYDKYLEEEKTFSLVD